MSTISPRDTLYAARGSRTNPLTIHMLAIATMKAVVAARKKNIPPARTTARLRNIKRSLRLRTRVRVRKLPKRVMQLPLEPPPNLSTAQYNCLFFAPVNALVKSQHRYYIRIRSFVFRLILIGAMGTHVHKRSSNV